MYYGKFFITLDLYILLLVYYQTREVYNFCKVYIHEQFPLVAFVRVKLILGEFTGYHPDYQLLFSITLLPIFNQIFLHQMLILAKIRLSQFLPCFQKLPALAPYQSAHIASARSQYGRGRYDLDSVKPSLNQPSMGMNQTTAWYHLVCVFKGLSIYSPPLQVGISWPRSQELLKPIFWQ